jgi:AAA+ ATPase superfamily predicted ATPase
MPNATAPLAKQESVKEASLFRKDPCIYLILIYRSTFGLLKRVEGLHEEMVEQLQEIEVDAPNKHKNSTFSWCVSARALKFQTKCRPKRLYTLCNRLRHC